MSFESVISSIGRDGQLFFEAVPDAVWLVYVWAKGWQGLLGGVLLVIAARIFSQGSLRAARIRAAATIRAAQISAGVTPPSDLRLASLGSSSVAPSSKPSPKDSPEDELVNKIEDLRSLIRSAMSTLTSDAGKADSEPNFFCERIALLRLDESNLPATITPAALVLYRKLSAQLENVHQAVGKRAPQVELSHELVQLNARAREFLASSTPTEAADRTGPLSLRRA